MAQPAPLRRISLGSLRPASRAWVAALGLSLLLSGATGCMVMDELDSAAAKMPTTAQNKKAQQQSKAGAAGSAASARSAVLERSQQWWKQAKSMTPGEKSAEIVSCRFPDGTRFMAKEDCVVQGGSPGTSSG